MSRYFPFRNGVFHGGFTELLGLANGIVRNESSRSQVSRRRFENVSELQQRAP
jgi:hypothetical protein